MHLQVLWFLALSTVTSSDNALAVFALGNGDPGASVRLAAQARQECRASVPGIISADETGRRLRGRPEAGPALVMSLEASQAALARSKQLYADSRAQESLEAIEKLVGELEADEAWTPKKEEVLTHARLMAVLALITVSASKETGRGETADGRRARDHLVRLLSTQPLYQLDPATYSPKMRLLMDYARKAVSTAKHGQLEVMGIPGEPMVYVEGHAVGIPPLRMTLPTGTYRIWLQKDGMRSLQRRVSIGEGVTPFHSDYEMEYRIDPFNLRVNATTDDASVALLGHLSRLVGNTHLALVEIPQGEGDMLARILVYNAQSATVRRGTVIKGQGQLVQSICRFATIGDAHLRIDSSHPKAKVWMDDVWLGETPLPVIEGLAAGPHHITVRFQDQLAEVDTELASGTGTKLVVTVHNRQLLIKAQAEKGVKGQLASTGSATRSHDDINSTPSEESRRPPLWLVPAGAGSGLAALSLPIVLSGLGVTISAIVAIALYPKSGSGQFRPYPDEASDQALTRLRLTAVAAVTGTLLMGTGVGVGLVGACSAALGLLLR